MLRSQTCALCHVLCVMSYVLCVLCNAMYICMMCHSPYDIYSTAWGENMRAHASGRECVAISHPNATQFRSQETTDFEVVRPLLLT